MSGKVSAKLNTSPKFREIIEPLQIAFEDQFRNYLYSQREKMHYGEFFDPLFEDLIEYATRPAKRVRPMLLLLSYKLFSKKDLSTEEIINDTPLMRAAMAVELLHAFILIHDDVIDRSELRRNLPTFHKLVEERMGNCAGRTRAGENVSIVFGDIVFALAIETFCSQDISNENRQKAFQKFLKYSCDTGSGEILDILLSIKDLACVKEEEILQTYHLKTTRYTFECPLVLGATLAGSPPEILQELTRLSEPLGLAFQIENDMQEFDLEEKAFQSDLLESKKTLLIRKTYDLANESERAFIRSCFEAPILKNSVLFKLQELILKTGAYHGLREKSQALFDQANNDLESSPFSTHQKQMLAHYIKFLQKQFHKHSGRPSESKEFSSREN